MKMKSAQGQTKSRSHHTLILTLNEATPDDLLTSKVNETKRKIEKSLSPSEINFEVLSFKPNKKGEMVEILPTKADQEKAITKLQEKGASLGFTAKKARDRLPRLIITGIPGDFNRENLIENLKTSNSNISQILDANPTEQLKLVTLLSTRDPDKKNAVIETTPSLYKNITTNNNIKLGMCLYPV